MTGVQTCALPICLEDELQKTSEVRDHRTPTGGPPHFSLVSSTRQQKRVLCHFIADDDSSVFDGVSSTHLALHPSTPPPPLRPLQIASATVEENSRLKGRLQVAEASRKETNSAEQDYEEVIQLLEAEIRDLKNQVAGKRPRSLESTKVRDTETAPPSNPPGRRRRSHPTQPQPPPHGFEASPARRTRSVLQTDVGVLSRRQGELMELNRRMTAVGGQLRKSELSRRHLEISNKKLLGFAQVGESLVTPRPSPV